MIHRRYAVIDATGLVINIVLVDDPFPANYWPGYGVRLVDLGPAIGAYNPPTLTNSGYPTVVMPTALPPRLEVGDTINLSTGAVTKYVPIPVMGTDGDGNPAMVNPAAPAQPFTNVTPLGIARV